MIISKQSDAGNSFVVSVLALGLLAIAFGQPVANGSMAFERSDINFKVNLVSVSATLTIGLLLAKLFGPIGAASGFFMSNTLATMARHLAFSRIIINLPKEDIV